MILFLMKASFFLFDTDVTCFHYYSGQQVLSLTLIGNIVGCKDPSFWKQVIAGIALIFLYFKSELVRALLLEFFFLRRRLTSPNSELARKFCKPPEAATLAEAAGNWHGRACLVFSASQGQNKTVIRMQRFSSRCSFFFLAKISARSTEI